MFGLALGQPLFWQQLVHYLIQSPTTVSQNLLLLINTFTKNLDYFIGLNTLNYLSFMKYI